jgi:hypothetical protein
MNLSPLTYSKVASGYRVEAPITVALYGHITASYSCRYFSITKNVLTVYRGYVWDGASGPVINTRSLMLASLVHDVCYQLLRMGYLPQCRRKDADREFRGLIDAYADFHYVKPWKRSWLHFRAKYCYYGVRIFGAKFAQKSRYDEYQKFTV